MDKVLSRLLPKEEIQRSKQMKRGSLPCVIREFNNKTTIRFHGTTSIRTVEVQNTDTPNAGEDGAPQSSQSLLEGMQNGVTALGDSLVVS